MKNSSLKEAIFMLTLRITKKLLRI